MNAMTMRIVRGADGMQRHVPTLAAPPAKRGRKRPAPADPMKTNGEASAEQLRLLIERAERLEEEKQGIADDLKDVFGEARSTGFDVKTMKAIMRLRKMDKHHRDEAEELLETYAASLGLR